MASDVADAVEICLFDDDGVETRVELPQRTAGVFHGWLPDVEAGQRYGLRVHGPWEPSAGLRCNPDKLLIDPHATAISGPIEWGEAVFAHHFADTDAYNDADSASSMPKCVVTDRSFDWSGDAAPRTALADTIVYETHVKGISRRHPDVPDDVAGTYAGLAHPAITGPPDRPRRHRRRAAAGASVRAGQPPARQGPAQLLGLPTASGSWRRTASTARPATPAVRSPSSRRWSRRCTRPGWEVILDVVYNHTAEGNTRARR